MYNSGTSPTAVAQDIVAGLMFEGEPVARQMANSQNENSVSGTQHFYDANVSLSRDLGGQIVGTDLADRVFQLDSASWKMLQYGGKFKIAKQHRADLEQYLQVMEVTLQQNIQDAFTGIDADFHALLDGATNTLAAGNGAWSASSSTPTLDIQEALRTKCPGADLMYLGWTTAFELSRHPELKERSSFYTDGGSLSISGRYAQLRSVLSDISGIPAANIFIQDRFYNSADPDLAATLATIAGDFAWIGYKRGLFNKVGLEINEEESSGVNDIVNYATNEVAIQVSTTLECEITGV